MKEMVIVNTNEQGDTDFEGPVEDQFDFSMEYDIAIRWAITNSTCQQAKQNNSNYACRSTNSSCLHVTHGAYLWGIVAIVLPASKEIRTYRAAAKVHPSHRSVVQYVYRALHHSYPKWNAY